jgi:hypothetical protein
MGAAERPLSPIPDEDEHADRKGILRDLSFSIAS